MSTVLPALAVSFAAFCVWLTVRIINRHERWAKRTLAATVGLPVLYVLSFGPWCWITSVLSDEPANVPAIYFPILSSTVIEHRKVFDVIFWYGQLFSHGQRTMQWRPTDKYGDEDFKLVPHVEN